MRFVNLTDWKVINYYGVSLCRPSHTTHYALIPIFVTVGSLIISSGCLYMQTDEKHYFRLFISQIIVLLGNGIIGPNKIFMTLFGNGFEVLWLWSIVQSFMNNNCFPSKN